MYDGQLRTLFGDEVLVSHVNCLNPWAIQNFQAPLRIRTQSLSQTSKVKMDKHIPINNKITGEKTVISGRYGKRYKDNSILFYPMTLEGRRGTTDEFATIPFHLILFSAALVELAKPTPVHSLILSSHLFFCLPRFLFPFTVPCRIVFAKPEDIETWPKHLSFRFLTRVRSSSYSPILLGSFCEPPHW